MNSKLAYCTTFLEQKEWCKAALLRGQTLTDPGLWVSGVDPARVIRALRKDGLPIKTCFVRTVDAAGEVHPKTLAWRLSSIAGVIS